MTDDVIKSFEELSGERENVQSTVSSNVVGGDVNPASAYATGKRKESIARVWIKPGKGFFRVNGKDVSSYFARPVLRMIAAHSFDVSRSKDMFDVFCTVKGGGLSGQAAAIRHGIAKALSVWDRETYRSVLKSAGLITRDSRCVERKKYGRRKARKSFQFSKR